MPRKKDIMHKASQLAVTAALVVPALLSAAGVATAAPQSVVSAPISASDTGFLSGLFADDDSIQVDSDNGSFVQSTHSVDVDGAVSDTIATGFDADGNAYYERETNSATAEGFSSSSTSSWS
ncbi:hypothetical protein [Streptomyces sp. MS2.AVA.5]|uniref:Uncharacterized protein n=1 Tax=Streptomyces achmelvichensis TaxID=3134111 RepID=A0ACC6Q8D7_9ACTN